MNARTRILLLLAATPVAVGAVLLAHDRPPPPVRLVLSTWELTLAAHAEKPALDLQITGSALAASTKRPVRIPVCLRETVFKEMRVNGHPAKPVRDNGWFWIEITRPGDFCVTAELAARPEYDRGEYRLRLTKPPCVRAVVELARVGRGLAWELEDPSP